MRLVGLEEHFATTEIVEAWKNVDLRWRDLAFTASSGGEAAKNLLDLGPKRLAEMDAAGIDVAVLSLTTPGVQNLDADLAMGLARSSNDQLAAAVDREPGRLQGFAALPTPSPHVAARELDRAIRELGLHGAILHGRTRDRNLSDEEFWPIFEAADSLRAPLYLHPQSPRQAVREAYYSGFGENLDALFATAGIGWHVESGLQLIRLILAGVFDRFPNLQIITGHWGEVVLFYLDRIDMMTSAAKLPRKISEYLREHVSVTASGMLNLRYLQWSLEVLGPDRILLATDYPFAPSPPGGARRFLEAAQLSDVDRSKIASGNWDKLCSAIRR